VAVTIEQFVGNLVQSGLMSADEVSAFEQGLPVQKQPHDAQMLARELVAAGKLTKYQAQLVYQGRPKGLVFGEYTVLDKLGQGGMGVVLKARHRKLGRVVAVKVLPPAAMKSPDAVKRFYREVAAAGRLVHPNIVTAYDAGENEGIHYLAMEYVDGKDLASVVKERGPLEVKQALDCVLQAAKGLEYAHGEGVIHRDIKPGNLLLDKKGNVKILDMGLARVALAAGTDDPGSERLTQSGQVMGTCDYMAPEQAEDTRKADHRSDIYSLGCTLYRLLTGKVPYSGDSLVQVLLAHQNAPVPSLRAARPDVPEDVDALFQKMMAKRPADRYQSMGEVIADVESCLGSSSRPPVAGLVEEPESEFLPQSLAFLQEAPPLPSATKQRIATLADDTLRRVAREETGTGIVGTVKRALASARRTPLAMLAVGGGAAALVVIVGLVLTIAGRGRTTLPLPPGEGRGEGSGDQNVASGSPHPSPLPKGEGTEPPPLAVAPFDAATARSHRQAWAKYLGVEVEMTNSTGMKLVLIPPGEFEMGSDYLEVDRALPGGWDSVHWPEFVRSEAPRHHVKITKPFYLGVHEVTQGEYRRVTGNNPSHFSDTGAGKDQVAAQDTSRLPVENVSHEEAKEFCRRLAAMAEEKAAGHAYRLPTEAEWEYACRAGTETPYWTGEDPNTLEGAANLVDGTFERTAKPGPSWRVFRWDDGFAYTAPVGSFRPNPYGLHDMLGNVWEWVADWWSADYYQQSPREDPPGPPSGREAVRRGACWYDAHAMACRCAFRRGADPNKHDHLTGFRVAVPVARSGIGHGSAATQRIGPPSNAPAVPTASPKVKATLRAALSGFSSAVTAFAFAPDGKTLVANGFGHGKVSEWDVATASKLRIVHPHDEIIASLAYAADGRIVAIGTYRRATVWTPSNGDMRHRYTTSETVVSAAFSPDSQLLALGSADGSLWLWNVQAVAEVWHVSQKGSNDCLAFSPDGRTLASCGWDNMVRLWDVASGNEAGKLAGHEGRVRSIAFSGDGRLIASASEDKTARLWAVANRSQAMVLDHPDKVRSISFSRDGSVVATGCEDGGVRLWSAQGGQLLATLEDHRGPVHCVAFAPQGDLLASGGEDKTIGLWDVRIGASAAAGPSAGATVSPQDIPIGVWIPLLGPENERIGRHEGPAKIVFGERRMEMRLNGEGCTLWHVPVSAADVAIRGRVKKLPGATSGGNNAGLKIRCLEGQYYAGILVRNDQFEIGAGNPWRVLKAMKVPPVQDGFVEMEFAAVGNTLTLTVNGQVLLTVEDQSIRRKEELGVSVFQCDGVFEDLQYKILRR